MKTKKELDDWIASNPWPISATHEQSLDWHKRFIEFEFGEGSYVIVTSAELESVWWSGIE